MPYEHDDCYVAWGLVSEYLKSKESGENTKTRIEVLTKQINNIFENQGYLTNADVLCVLFELEDIDAAKVNSFGINPYGLYCGNLEKWMAYLEDKKFAYFDNLYSIAKYHPNRFDKNDSEYMEELLDKINLIDRAMKELQKEN